MGLYGRANLPENLEVETAEEVDTNPKILYILRSEVEKATKEMTDKKSTDDDIITGDVLILLGEDGLRLTTQLIKNMCETRMWPKDLIEVTMSELEREQEATKCREQFLGIEEEVCACFIDWTKGI
jgi:hypothetical protein